MARDTCCSDHPQRAGPGFVKKSETVQTASEQPGRPRSRATGAVGGESAGAGRRLPVRPGRALR